jgi:hypothetical protein
MSVQELQISLQNLINQDFNLSALETILSPVPLYTGNNVFASQFGDIVKILTQDRDLDKKFTVNDLVLFSKDIIGMTTLVTSLLLILNSIPNIKIKYVEGETEQLIFKLVVYIFLVIIPQYTKLDFTKEEKTAILNVCMLFYVYLIQSQLLKKIIIKIATWVKNEWIACLSSGSLLDRKMPKLHHKLNEIIKQKI